MHIDIGNPNPPLKMYLEEEAEEAAFVLLRTATANVLKKIRGKTHTRRFKNVKGVVYEYYEINEDLYDLLLWEYCLPGWGNLKDEEEKKIEYSSKMAVYLLDNSPVFAEWINEKLDEITDLLKKKAEASEKN